jgi:hypothetical protein
MGENDVMRVQREKIASAWTHGVSHYIAVWPRRCRQPERLRGCIHRRLTGET